MASVDRNEDESVAQPSAMDEGWWKSVLQDEENSAAEARRPASKLNGAAAPGACAADWAWARELYETDQIIELTVVGCNRGGLLADARSLRGFIPISHLVSLGSAPDEFERSRALQAYQGRQLTVKVIEYDPERGRLVFSERAAQAAPGQRPHLLATLEPGQVTRGTVTNVTRFGVFVDLGGLEGLIHVSELSWGRVRHPADVVRCGQTLEVMVISVDRDQGRVGLSLKDLLPDPWKSLTERYHVGEIVEGHVTNLVRFGAFVGLEDGLEGLVHTTEMGPASLGTTEPALAEGDCVRARIIHLDPVERRMGLSLRDVEPPVYGEDDRAVEGEWAAQPTG
jgi:small subunit ribosomal protein S1